jgi:hypothetical protein
MTFQNRNQCQHRRSIGSQARRVGPPPTNPSWYDSNRTSSVKNSGAPASGAGPSAVIYLPPVACGIPRILPSCVRLSCTPVTWLASLASAAPSGRHDSQRYSRKASSNEARHRRCTTRIVSVYVALALLQHRRRVDGDVDGVRRDALVAHVTFGEVLATDGRAWPLHISTPAKVAFHPADCAARFGFAPAHGLSVSMAGGGGNSLSSRRWHRRKCLSEEFLNQMNHL